MEFWKVLTPIVFYQVKLLYAARLVSSRHCETLTSCLSLCRVLVLHQPSAFFHLSSSSYHSGLQLLYDFNTNAMSPRSFYHYGTKIAKNFHSPPIPCYFLHNLSFQQRAYIISLSKQQKNSYNFNIEVITVFIVTYVYVALRIQVIREPSPDYLITILTCAS